MIAPSIAESRDAAPSCAPAGGLHEGTAFVPPPPPPDEPVSPDLQVLFGQRLRTARLRANVTQADLGDQVGLTGPYISKVESGQINVTIATMQRLAEALGLDVAAMLRRPRPKSR